MKVCALLLVTAVAVSRSATDKSAHHRSRQEFTPRQDKSQYCEDHGCDGADSPRTNAAEGEDVELDTIPDSSAQQWTLFSAIRDTLTSVKDTLVYNVYTKPLEYAYDQATEFAEKVRYVFREEFYNFLDYLWERGVGTDTKSGKP